MRGTAGATTVAVVAPAVGAGQLGAPCRGMALAGVNGAVLCSDHDHRLVLVVDDSAAGRRVSAAWTGADDPAGAAPSLLL